jgi:hypothetical protein
MKLKSEMSREGHEGCEEGREFTLQNLASLRFFARHWLNFQLSTLNLQPLDYRRA